MMCYRDMSFCSDAEVCSNKTTCRRYFSEDHRSSAEKWWGGQDAPVCFMDFHNDCPDFKEIKQ